MLSFAAASLINSFALRFSLPGLRSYGNLAKDLSCEVGCYQLKTRIITTTKSYFKNSHKSTLITYERKDH